MNIFLPDSFYSVSRQGNSHRPTKTASLQASARELRNRKKKRGTNAAAWPSRKTVSLTISLATEAITVEVGITTEIGFQLRRF